MPANSPSVCWLKPRLSRQYRATSPSAAKAATSFCADLDHCGPTMALGDRLGDRLCAEFLGLVQDIGTELPRHDGVKGVPGDDGEELRNGSKSYDCEGNDPVRRHPHT